MQVTENGEVTIPAALREQYGLLPHTEIEFVERHGELVLRRVEEKRRPQSRGAQLIERLSGSATIPMTTEEIMRLTRGDDWGT